MTEMWKPVDGFESLYAVSSFGNVMSLGIKPKRNKSNVILKPSKGKYGHCRVQLCRDGTKVLALVHRLVAIAFISEPPPKCEVNHIDFDPTNNRVENLEWVTHQQNIYHSRHRIGEKGESHSQNKLTEQQVHEMRERYAQGGISFVKLGKLYGICGQQCHRIVRGQRWGHI